MKWLYNTGAILFMVCYLASCSDYLEVEHNFKDRLTIEKVFTNRDYTDSWLSNTYSYLRDQIRILVEKRVCRLILPMIFIGQIGIIGGIRI